MIPSDLKDDFKSQVIKARNLIVVNNLNKENKKERIKEYSEIIQDVKTKYNIIVTPDNINTVFHIVGLNDEFVIPFYITIR